MIGCLFTAMPSASSFLLTSFSLSVVEADRWSFAFHLHVISPRLITQRIKGQNFRGEAVDHGLHRLVSQPRGQFPPIRKRFAEYRPFH